jgi:hypothetical protein
MLLSPIKINKFKIEILSKKQISQDKAFLEENLTVAIKKILKKCNKELVKEERDQEIEGALIKCFKTFSKIFRVL